MRGLSELALSQARGWIRISLARSPSSVNFAFNRKVLCMSRLLFHLIFSVALCATPVVWGSDADLLTGKWSAKKINDDGLNCTQTIDIKKDKFVFEMLGPTGQLLAYAEGDLRFERLGPFSAVRFSHMRA